MEIRKDKRRVDVAQVKRAAVKYSERNEMHKIRNMLQIANIMFTIEF